MTVPLTLLAVPTEEASAAKAAAPGAVSLKQIALNERSLLIVDARQFTMTDRPMSPSDFMRASQIARSFSAQLTQALQALTGMTIPVVVTTGDALRDADIVTMAKLGWVPAPGRS